MLENGYINKKLLLVSRGGHPPIQVLTAPNDALTLLMRIGVFIVVWPLPIMIEVVMPNIRFTTHSYFLSRQIL